MLKSPDRFQIIFLQPEDGKNPATPGIYKALSIMGETTYQLVSRIFSINITTLKLTRIVFRGPLSLCLRSHHLEDNDVGKWQISNRL